MMIKQAKDYLELVAENEALKQQNRELLAHVERLTNEIKGIIDDSVGVAGYHLNDDVALWGEFEIEAILEESPIQSLQLLTDQEVVKVYTDAIRDWEGDGKLDVYQIDTIETLAEKYAKRKGGE